MINTDYDRWRLLMAISKKSEPKEYGAYKVNQKKKLRGGSKRK